VGNVNKRLWDCTIVRSAKSNHAQLCDFEASYKFEYHGKVIGCETLDGYTR
jgi:hypothetical protein